MLGLFPDTRFLKKTKGEEKGKSNRRIKKRRKNEDLHVTHMEEKNKRKKEKQASKHLNGYA